MSNLQNKIAQFSSLITYQIMDYNDHLTSICQYNNLEDHKANYSEKY